MRALAPTKRVPRAAAPLRCEAAPAGGGGCCDARGPAGSGPLATGGPLVLGALLSRYLARRRRRSTASTTSPIGHGAAAPPAPHW